MSAPIANFTYTANGLSVSFTDSSLNVPTSWAWDFGDPSSGNNNTSILQNPTHLFTLPGNYLMSLTATNVDGISQKTLLFYVSEGAVLLSIKQMVQYRLPANMTVEVPDMENLIKVQQLYLAPMIDPNMPQSQIFDENSWSPLANALVAALVVYQIIISQVNKLTLALSNTSSDTTTTTQAALKKLVTGPSEAEWYNQTEAVTNFLSSTFKSGSVFEKTTVAEVCSLSRRLNITHPLCPDKKKRPTLPQVFKFD
jgi:PKD repeat protein